MPASMDLAAFTHCTDALKRKGSCPRLRSDNLLRILQVIYSGQCTHSACCSCGPQPSPLTAFNLLVLFFRVDHVDVECRKCISQKWLKCHSDQNPPANKNRTKCKRYHPSNHQHGTHSYLGYPYVRTHVTASVVIVDRFSPSGLLKYVRHTYFLTRQYLTSPPSLHLLMIGARFSYVRNISRYSVFLVSRHHLHNEQHEHYVLAQRAL